MTAVAEDAREQQLAWEARQRPRAGAAAIAAAILMLGGFIWWGIVLRDLPPAGFLESLGNLQQPGPIGEQPSVQNDAVQYYVDNAVGFIGNDARLLRTAHWLVETLRTTRPRRGAPAGAPRGKKRTSS